MPNLRTLFGFFYVVFFVVVFHCTACVSYHKESGNLISVIQDEDAKDFAEIAKIVKAIRPNVDEFRIPGPIPIVVKKQLVIPLSAGQSISYDMITPKKSSSHGPMVVLVHGNRSYKEAHRYQGEHLASFGFQVFIPQLPTSEVWSTNGLIIKEFVQFMTRSTKQKVFLIGHSFGGSAITMAAYLGSKVSGLVYLDPAIFNQSVASLLWNTKIPAILIGADSDIYRSKKRHLFREKYGGPFFELSVRGATHNDAQYPSMFALSHYGLDPAVSKKNQKLITCLMTASLFSLLVDRDHQFVDTLARKLSNEGIVFDIFRRGSLGTLGK